MAKRIVGLVLLLSGCDCGDDGEVRITTETLPDGVVGAAYEARLAAAGDGDLVWGFVSGRLPVGLSISTGGTIEGTPAAEGDFAFTVRVTNAVGAGDVADLTLHVEGGASGIRLVTDSLPDGRVGEEYSERLEAEGGLEPYSFGLAAGALPPGLSLSLGGLIDGTPADGTETTLTVRIFDAAGGVGTGQVDLVIVGSDDPPQFDTDLLPEGREGDEYFASVEASGGLAPLTFTSVGRDLPDGLTLSEDGDLSGTPEEGGLFEITLRVTDSADRSSERDFYLPIEPAPLVFFTDRLPTGRTGEEYDATLIAQGGVRPYRFEIVDGVLPDGLELANGGDITGVPATGGGEVIDFRVRDADGRIADRRLALDVAYFAEVEPDVDLPGTCELGGSEESVAAELVFPTPGMVSEVDVGVSITFNDVSYLTVALESPTGKRVVLYSGDLMGGGPDDLEAFYDEQDAPVSSLDQFIGEPSEGTWRLVATITTSAWGDCTTGGSIDRFSLAIATNPSPDDYFRISGWDTNNLIQVPWVRITGGGLDQDSIDFEVHQWTTGDNQIAEGGAGDDVDLGDAALEWSTDLPGDVATIDEEGVLQSGEETGAGTVEGTDGAQTYEFDVLVVPPDWVP